jgi:hypothetical protein
LRTVGREWALPRRDDTNGRERRDVGNAPSVVNEQRDVRPARCEADARPILQCPRTPTTSPSLANLLRATLGADPDIIGKTVAINAVPHTSSASHPLDSPARSFGVSMLGRPIKIAQRNSMNVQIVARLKPGVTSDDVVRS